MSDHPLPEAALPEAALSSTALPEAALPEVALPEPVRDHLGQQLRSVFGTDEAVPEYLGDPVMPAAFGPQLRRLETRLKTHEEGTGAVAQALDGLVEDLTGKAS